MGKRFKRLLLITTIIGVGYFVIKFLMITFFVFFSNKTRDGELRPEEVKLFNEIKSELNLEKISRTPEYDITEPKENEIYGLYLEYLNCNITKDSLDNISRKIVLKIDKKLILSHNFSSIDFTFYRTGCTPYIISYSFSKNDIDKLKKEKKF